MNYDLELFTKGQPIELYKELREQAPVYYHHSMPTDPEPGHWVLTKYEDIKSQNMRKLLKFGRKNSKTNLPNVTEFCPKLVNVGKKESNIIY